MFATYTITPARAQKVAFAGPYFDSGAAIMVKKDNSSITKVDDLAGKNVATESNSTAVAGAQEVGPDRPRCSCTQEDAQCLAAVQQGRADAYVLDQCILISDAIRNPAVKVVGKPFTVEPVRHRRAAGRPGAKKFVERLAAEDLRRRLVGQAVEGDHRHRGQRDAPTPPKIGSVPGS